MTYNVFGGTLNLAQSICSDDTQEIAYIFMWLSLADSNNNNHHRHIL